MTIGYTIVFGQPLVLLLGMILLPLLIGTAILGYLSTKNAAKYFKYHKICAFSTIALALVHGLLGILANFFGI